MMVGVVPYLVKIEGVPQESREKIRFRFVLGFRDEEVYVDLSMNPISTTDAKTLFRNAPVSGGKDNFYMDTHLSNPVSQSEYKRFSINLTTSLTSCRTV